MRHRRLTFEPIPDDEDVEIPGEDEEPEPELPGQTSLFD